MGELGRIHQILVHLGDYTMTFNMEVMIMTWIVFGFLIFFGYMTARNSRRSLQPGTLQVVGELLVSNLYSLTEDAMGTELAKKYSPMISALFLFLLTSNWIGIIPIFEEPTKDLNTTLSMGTMVFVVSHYAGIKAKGLKAYLRAYVEPIFFMAPLNIIGEIAKVVSISFRLFGNIMGGSIIILVITYLCYSLILPPFLNAFFGLFAGSIQAFVFTMLSIVYISVMVN
ncbi:MAG: F0F1 ATP synthase subunit A [Desulfatirhabdiaceae bacterium]